MRWPVSSVASADVTGVNIDFQHHARQAEQEGARASKHLLPESDTHAGNLPCPLGTANDPSCYAFPPSIQSAITFPKDLKFNPGNIPDCIVVADRWPVHGQRPGGLCGVNRRRGRERPDVLRWPEAERHDHGVQRGTLGR